MHPPHLKPLAFAEQSQCFLRANYATNVATHRARNRYIRRLAEAAED
jgi:hypothetical protein